jgi:hypothetical protein
MSLLKVKWYNLRGMDAEIVTRCWCDKAEVLAGMYQRAGYTVKQRSPFMDFNEYLTVYRKGTVREATDGRQKLNAEVPLI